MNSLFRLFSIFLCVILLCGLCSCGSSSGASGRKNGGSSSVEDVIESEISKEDNTDIMEGDPVSASDGGSSDALAQGMDEEPVDVDLTVMSSTMVFAEVSSMLAEPSSFMGKSVKMSGQFAVLDDPSTGNVYCACVVKDATACCANGIEFVLAGEPVYPIGYPEVGAEITVTGVFDTYEENGFYYITLREARLL